MQQLLPAILPTPRLETPWWAERHAHIVEHVRTRPDVNLLLIGDSITQNYEKANPPDENFLPTWQQFYAPRHALNLGFSGDTTANLLWRLANGEIDGLRPAVAILLIGTNNTGHDHQNADQTIAGIKNVIGTLAQRLPQTRILLLGILPSDVSPEKTAADKAVNAWLAKRYGTKPAAIKAETSNPSTTKPEADRQSTTKAEADKPSATSSVSDIRKCHSEQSEETPHSSTQPPTPGCSEAANTATNLSNAKPDTDTNTAAKRDAEVKTAARTEADTKTEQESRITYLDISSTFMNPDGTLNTAIFYDPRLPAHGKPLHPDTTGQRKMAEAIEPALAKLMNDKPRTTPPPTK
jgi:lysophospholipase L1-like esterase